MTPDTPASIEPRVTIDELRHRAEALKSKAVAEAKGAADAVLGEDGKHALMVIVGVALVAASVAYFIGTRSARCTRPDDYI